jgi:two-component system, OmpR family, alkaline phosphatase synthesis response regulator PhoP
MSKKQSSHGILIIDDDASLIEILVTKLKAAGLEVEGVQGAELGLLRAKELGPELILLDMQMPKMSGADVLLKLKEDKSTKNSKVVFLTSFGDEKMIDQEKMIYGQMGAVDYLKKTDDLDVLVSQIKTYLS